MLPPAPRRQTWSGRRRSWPWWWPPYFESRSEIDEDLLAPGGVARWAEDAPHRGIARLVIRVSAVGVGEVDQHVRFEAQFLDLAEDRHERRSPSTGHTGDPQGFELFRFGQVRHLVDLGVAEHDDQFARVEVGKDAGCLAEDASLDGGVIHRPGTVPANHHRAGPEAGRPAEVDRIVADLAARQHAPVGLRPVEPLGTVDPHDGRP